MPQLEVSGADLYYETFGFGHLVILIPGANGRGVDFHNMAKSLSSKYGFTTICWDRRGYSRSLIKGPQDFANRLNTDADDTKALIEHIAAETKQPAQAIVFGNSSGGSVAHTVLMRHPDSVKFIIAHEPPLWQVLPEKERDHYLSMMDETYNIYRASGIIPGKMHFGEKLGLQRETVWLQRTMQGATTDEFRANSLFWFEFELTKQHVRVLVDLEKVKENADKYEVAAGVDTGEGPLAQPAMVLAKTVNKEVLRVPGGHVGFLIKSDDFADTLGRFLKRKI